MPAFIGIDGGATGAVAVVTDPDGGILARVRGGAALVDASDPAAGAADLAALAASALDEAALPSPAAVLCCALAGARREVERQAVREAVERFGCARRVLVTTDGEAALADAFGGRTGILLIAGTGSVGWGRGDDGRTVRVGGWGRLLGDEGSGYGLALAALRAAARAADGRARHTILLDRVIEHARVDGAEQLIGWAGRATKAEIAALVPAIFAAAAGGDEVADEILDKAAKHLADHVGAVHRRIAHDIEPPQLALAGGLLRQGGPLAHKVVAGVAADGLDLPLCEKAVDAAAGAAALARGGHEGFAEE